MAQQVVTQLIVDSSGAKQGVAEFEAAMKRAKDAAVQGGNATVSSFEQAQKRWVQSLGATDPVIKAQIAMERDLARQRKVNDDAVKMGIATHAAAEAQLQKVRQRHVELIAAVQQGATANTMFGRTVVAANDNLRSYAASLGPMGSLLTALGPAGIVAAAALAVVTLGVHQLVQATNQLADKSGKMVDFSETTGLSTRALQALTKAGAEVGLEADKIGTSFERFSTELFKLRTGSGELVESLNRIDPALTREMETARDAAAAWDVLNRARERAGSLEEKQALTAAVFGRRNLGMGRLQDASIEAGGMAGLIGQMRQVNVLTQEQMKRWDELKDKADYATRTAKDNFASIFADDVLETQKRAADQFLRLSEIAKSFTLSDDLRKLIGGGTAQGQLPGAFEPFGWLKTLIDVLPMIRSLQTGGAAAVPRGIQSGPTLAPPVGGIGDTFNDRFSAADGSLKRNPRAEAAELQRWIAAMGDAATAEQRRVSAQKQLAIVGKDAGLSQTELAKASRALDAAFASQALQARIGLLGQDASATDIAAAAQDRINKANLLGANISRDQAAAIKAKAVAQHEANQFQYRNQFEREQLGRDPVEAEVAARLLAEHGSKWKEHQDGADAAFIRQTIHMRELKGLMDDAGQSFLSSMMQGKSVTQSLVGAFSQLGQRQAQAGMSRLMNNPSTFFGNRDMASLGGGMTMLGAGMAGYQSASPMGGALGGAMAGAAFGPAGMAIGAVAGAIGGWLGAASKEAEEARQAAERLEQARDNWRRLAVEVQRFNDLANGRSTGSVTQGLRDLTRQMFDLAHAAFQAGDLAGEARLIEDYNRVLVRVSESFVATFDDMIAALNSGAGLDSPFVRAGQGMRQLAEGLKGFVDDVENIFSGLTPGSMSTAFITGGPGMLATGGGDAASQIAAAQAGARSVLIAALAGTAPLSDVATRLLEISGQASELQRALVDLGSSAGEAVTAISQASATARARLVTQFTEELQRQINSASGQDIVNEFMDLFAQVERARADAALLGTGTGLVDRFFALQAQRLVDQSNLVGDAFGDLIRQFPQLTGVIHQSTVALEEMRSAQNAAARSVLDYINGLLAGPESGLSPGARLAAAQSAYSSNLGLARTGNAEAQGLFARNAEALRSAAQAMFGSSSGFQSILSGIIADGLSLPAVQAADDPVVVAMRDVLSAVQAGNAINAGLLTASQLAALGLATETRVSTLLTAPQLQASGLASNTTVAGLLTAAQIAQLGLATNAVAAGLLTAQQLQNAGLATNVTAAGLLTQAQLGAAGLASNAAVTGLLTQSQIQALGLATDTRVGSLLTQAQLEAAGLAANTTVAGLLTAAQLAQQGLATNTTAVGIQAAAIGTEQNTSAAIEYFVVNVQRLDTTIARLNDAIANLGTVVQRLDTSNAVLDQIRQLNTTSSQQLELLIRNYTLPASGVRIVSVAGQGLTRFDNSNVPVGQSLDLRNDMLEALNKIVWNTYLISRYTAEIIPGFGAGASAGRYATGGVIPPFGLGLVSEHSAGGGRFIRAGSEPITVSPHAPSNDNGVVAELRQLNRDLQRRLDQMESRLIAAEMGGAQHVREGVDDLHEQGESWRNTEEKIARRPKTAGWSRS